MAQKRHYTSTAKQASLSSAIDSVVVSITLDLVTGFPTSYPYTLVIDPDTNKEELVKVTASGGGTTLTVARGDDSTTNVAHSAGATVRHVVSAQDFNDFGSHVGSTAAPTASGVHNVTGDVVGTGGSQTLTAKTLTSPTITTPTISTPTITGTAIAANLTASGTVTAALFSGPLTGAVTGNVTGNITGNLTGTVTGGASLNLPLAGGTMSGAIAMGANKITGLGTPTANTTDAANTAYVDAAITTAVTNVIASAPALLDTLDELAAALGDDENFATTVTTNLALKAPLASPALTGVPTAPTAAGATNTTQIATTAYVMAANVAPSNLTGPITSVGSATTIASQTGTGTKFVVDTSPTLVTPVLGVATATSINGTSIPSTATLVKTSDTLAVLSSTTSAQLAGIMSDETGSGSLVFGTSPTIATPVISSPKISSTYSAKTAAYTFVSGDEGNIFSMNAATSVQFNIPTDATFNFAVGTEINVFWITGVGQPTIGAVTPGTTTVISTGATSATPKLRVANSGATCKKLAANSWIVFGDIS